MFAVVFTYNFDENSSVFLFEDEERAKQFLYDSFCKEREVESKEKGNNIDSLIAVDRTYATISSYWKDEDGEEYEDVCEYRLCYDVNYMGRKASKYLN